MSTEILQTIARVRRQMPRNIDVMHICDALEKAVIKTIADRAQHPPATKGKTDDAAGFDKKAYQRDYMRGRRKEK